MQQILIQWFKKNNRPLPWRKNRSAYTTWLSEIIFQQTRIEQGLGYFNKFLLHYPKITDLANDSEDNILKLWQGLGYYSRARNLHKTAQIIRDDYQGKFPEEYSEILKLKGVGEYTAAAISTFAFHKPKPLVDGNVYRLYSRLFKIGTEINTTKGKKEFSQLALELLSNLEVKDQIIYNEAIMEFGALVCKPKPNCDVCPISVHCLSNSDSTQTDYPKKQKKKQKKIRFLNFYLTESENGFWVEKRTKKDIWINLFQLPCTETTSKNNESLPLLFSGKHLLSHQELHISIYKSENLLNDSDYSFVSWSDWNEIAYPQPIYSFLEKYISERKF
jgi:A/G-specific adenine glycosylase